jgi:ABC-type transport system involved in multi-copper enzyme maturation permease subunit
MGEVFRFEIEYRLRSLSTWIYGALLLLLPFLMLHIINGSSSWMNSPERVVITSGIVGMLGMLVTAALFGDAATRDFSSGMHPLVFTTPMRKAEYLGGRFLGALAVNAVLLLGVPLGQIIGSLMPYMDPQMFGPFRPAAYAHAYLLFLLPNLVLTAAVLFTIAAVGRQILPAFLSGVALFIAYTFAGEMAGDLGASTMAALADPFGVRVVEGITRYWTPVQRSSQAIGFPAILLWNRLLWLGVAMAILALLHHSFRFGHPGGAPGRKTRRKVADADVLRTGPIVVPVVERSFGPRMRVEQTIEVARRALGEIARSRAFLAIAAGAVVFVFVVGWDVGDLVFGTSTWPVTHLIAREVLTGAAATIVAVLIALFAGELVWRERDVRVSEIADAAPVPGWVALLGRFLALVAMIVILQVVLMAAGVGLQALRGYHRHEIGLYLRILFGMKLIDYVLIAALAMAVHAIVNQKYLGHLVVVLYYVFTVFAGSFGVQHNLLVYGSDPGWVYSDMNGFGPFIAPFVWFKLYWAAWALLFALAANLAWVRGREWSVRTRVAEARSRLTGTVVRAGALAAMLVLALGGFIFYNTNILNDYSTPFEQDEWRAEYERRYRRFDALPQPRLVAARLRVEIYPDEGAADLRGTYRLVNLTARAIDSVHVAIAPEIRVRSIGFDRPARRVLRDDRTQFHIYALARALQPGDTLHLKFDVGFRPRGFPNSGIPTAVARNGAYFDARWLPLIGYQPAGELSGDKARREHSLPPSRPTPAADDPNARQIRSGIRNVDLVHIDAVIGTASNQIAITPGTLRREWTQNGRRYFHYRMDGPLPFGAAVLSAEYAVAEDRWRDVRLRVYHHPTHTFNVPQMLRGMKAALEYNSTHFGPYQFRELRVVEFPRYASFARAHPHTIAFSEGSAFLTRVYEGDVDRPFFVTAHETAHQWWGGQVIGARVRGASFVSETLAQYSAMMVMEKELGPEQVRRFYTYELERYLQSRRVYTNREVPLLDVEEQSYLYYHKGAVAMYTLRDHIGEARVNAALRSFLNKHRAGVPPYPTSRDLYAELRAVTPDSLRPLLRDLFEDVVLTGVRADGARVEPTGTGQYRVTLQVAAAKVRADSIGRETEIPMNDLAEIGVFAGPQKDGAPGEPLYLRRHRIRSGAQTITITVPRSPTRAGIDPYRKLIGLDAGANLVEVGPGADGDVRTRKP